MKSQTRTILYLVTGLILLAGVPASIAYRLGSETRLSPSPESDAYTQSWPAVAYNYVNHEYLVVWENTRPGGKNDIYARRVSDSGQLKSWFCVTTGANNRRQPAVAYNATNGEYLIVWEHEVSPGVSEIWGRIIAWNGGYMKPEFQIISWVNRGFEHPRVAWNSVENEYLVIWSAFDTGTLLHTDVACRRVMADGSMPYMHLIVSNVGEPQEVDVVYNVALNGYLAVWTRHGGATTGYDIRGAFLDKTGAVITPPGEFDVYAGASAQTSPAVTTNEQNHYMVVWQHFDNSYTPGDFDIYGRLFQANGSPVTAPFMLSTTTDDEMLPDVAANGASQQYLAVWHRYNAAGEGRVVARLRNANGTLATPVDVFYAPGWSAQAPAVACDIPGFLIAYEKGSPGWVPYHIYGRLYWPKALYLPLTLRNP